MGSVGRMVLCDCVFDRWDRKHVVKRFNRGGTKSAANATDSNVLGDLQDVYQGFGGSMGPDQETIQEDGESDGMENCLPTMEIDATYRVAEQRTSEGRLCLSSHNFSMWYPVELVIDEDTKVAHQR